MFMGSKTLAARRWRRSAALGLTAALTFGGTIALGAAPAFAAVQVSLAQSNPTPFVGSGDVFTATVTNNGTPAAQGTSVKFAPTGGLLPNEAYVGIARHAGGGYWLAGIDGTVLPEGGAPDLGGAPAGSQLIIGIAATPSGNGYFLLGADGSVTPKGDATFYGDVHGTTLNFPVVGMAVDNQSGGYWLVAEDGGVFSFNAPFWGSTGAMNVAPAVGLVPTSNDQGYSICEVDGACQKFGNAQALGFGDFSASSANNPVVAVAGTGDSLGIWALHADNTTEGVGDAVNAANVSDHNTPMVGLTAAAANGSDYWVVGLDGQVVAKGAASNLGDAFTQVTDANGVARLTVTSLDAATTTMSASSFGAQSAVLDTTWVVPPGYWMTGADGGVFTFGDATYMGSTGAQHLNKPIVGMAPTADGGGYYLVASDGGVFTFGDATFFGSTGAQHLNQPIVGMAVTPDGGGYYLVAADGGIFTFGDADFMGSSGAQHLNKPIVGMAATADGGGYWLVASDGGIFTFGDATFFGSTGAQHLNQPIVGMATPDDGGYWLVASDGGIFTFGDAPFMGSTGAQHLNKPIIGMAPTATGAGYWLFASDGGVFTFGDAAFAGSLGAQHLNAPIVTGASVPFPLFDLSAASTHPHNALTKSSVDSVLARKGIHWAG
jgi:hypothetical protein